MRYPVVALPDYLEYPPEQMLERAIAFRTEIARRRTVRDFSSKTVDRRVIEECLLAAGSAPSGANLQPWYFSVITSPEIKHRIREAAEVEEREFYQRRAPQAWKDALAPLHHAGLVSLTHTPSPMTFLNQLCGVDADHRAFLLLVVGYPRENATVPDIRRKNLSEIASFL